MSKNMSHWNRAYLDALEVPVWVPLNDQGSDQIQAENEERPSERSQQEDSSESVTPAKDLTESFQIVSGDASADLLFVASDKVEAATIAKNLRQLQFAWRAWTEQPFSAAVLQQASASDNSVDLEGLRGKLIDCRPEADKLEQPAIPAPSFDLKQASKKDWWLLLQRLYQ